MSWTDVIRFFQSEMPVPKGYGTFHLCFFVGSILLGILLCLFLRDTKRWMRPVLLITSVTVILLEVYKLITFGSTITDTGVSYSFPWSSFPWQFCSTPMYVGLLAGLTKGKLHNCLCAYLATFAVFAGLCVMIYPGDVFISYTGINVQTMICHGSMLTIGIYLLGTGYVRRTHSTVLKALPVFATTAAVAIGLNEWAYRYLPEGTYFNMFYFSPHQDPHLPLYSDVQRAIGSSNPLCIVVYIAGFTLAAYLILLIAMGIGKSLKKSVKSRKAAAR